MIEPLAFLPLNGETEQPLPRETSRDNIVVLVSHAHV